MISEGKDNSILVSGDRGVGKIETTKMLMRYLAHLGRQSGVEGHNWISNFPTSICLAYYWKN